MNATTTIKPQAPAMLSASELSRRANIPLGKLLKAIRSGAFPPDSTVMDGRLFLFSVARIEDAKRRVDTLDHMLPENDLVPA